MNSASQALANLGILKRQHIMMRYRGFILYEGADGAGLIPSRATKKHQNHLRVVFHLIAYADAHSLNTMRIGIIYIATSPA